jgi:hypothetical protein
MLTHVSIAPRQVKAARDFVEALHKNEGEIQK